MQVALAVVTLVPADQTGAVELCEVVLDLQGAVFGAEGPQGAGDDSSLVAETAVVVCLGEEAEEGPLGVDAHRGERLGDEGFRLDRAYPRHTYRPAFVGRAGDFGDEDATTAARAVACWGIDGSSPGGVVTATVLIVQVRAISVGTP
ncbi:hypothetical protein B591_14083 [Streptomyces sp. GBA 94-10 4N24]|nr:hypothetical protein B591_14083 [Streptomyces sp. GBA 94-10 4N24]UZN59799.1 hypothetical protein B591N_14083 [Streptomyces sp. GBA 94-10 4N24]